MLLPSKASRGSSKSTEIQGRSSESSNSSSHNSLQNKNIMGKSQPAHDDSESSSDEQSLVSSHSSNKSAAAGEETLVWKETQAVWCSKFIVFVAIILIGIAASLATLNLVRLDEEEDFSIQFSAQAQDVAKTSNSAIAQSFKIVGSLSRSMTSFAVHDNATFPFFTHPDFAVVGGDAKRLSGVDAIVYAPLVEHSELQDWEDYTRLNQDWYLDGLVYQGLEAPSRMPVFPIRVRPDPLESPRERALGEVQIANHSLPLWQMADAPVDSSYINTDLFSRGTFEHRALDVILKQAQLDRQDEQDATSSGNEAISNIATETNTQLGTILSDASYQKDLFAADQGAAGEEGGTFSSYLIVPVTTSFAEVDVGGFLIAAFSWQTFLRYILQEKSIPLQVVVKDLCGHQATFLLKGPNATLIAPADVHDPALNHYRHSVDLAKYTRYDGPEHDPVTSPTNGTVFTYDEWFHNAPQGHCEYTLDIYPTMGAVVANLEESVAIIYTTIVACIFAAILLLLSLYDCVVARRQSVLMSTARRTQAIVTNLFPKEVQKRMMEEHQSKRKPTTAPKGSTLEMFPGTGLKNASTSKSGKPIADLFPEATVFFADIVGFTAWSSTREPTQVFTLLETIYHAFDQIADNRRVFKVETVGDCYVAVTGLPTPRKDHAVVMARFAWEALHKFQFLVKEMETSLGPDTADLGLRTGLHSGPVTAGVLRGERSRFQLFGDTVNTASRIESNSMKNRIQLSQDTADELLIAGKSHWLQLREEKIHAKGKGEMQTYWLDIRSSGEKTTATSTMSTSIHSGAALRDSAHQENSGDMRRSHQSAHPDHSSNFQPADDEKEKRLVEWNTEILLRFLKEIEARRKYTSDHGVKLSKLRAVENRPLLSPLDEVVEIITLPQFDAKMKSKDTDKIDLGTDVVSQLHDFIATIAAMYRRNPFHNFEHASHVSMSTIKLLSRIVAPQLDTSIHSSGAGGRLLHDHTYGITSDPLTQFACAFSALIHDVDHTGVPNTQLINEKSKLAAVYRNQAVAEQNSVDLAWTLLMSDDYDDLRHAIYRTEEEFRRFRQLVVNSVMATDIMDKDLKELRNARWHKAFDEAKPDEEEDEQVGVNRKATIVIEHLIQASDVAHTMQHWHIYRKWNERLFQELYKAYKQGRADKDPGDFWYKGEIGFFDFYIIPLAKKLKDCGVFGVSSDEYLNYAERNRKEWELKGQEVVAMMMEKVKVMEFPAYESPGLTFDKPAAPSAEPTERLTDSDTSA